MLAATIPGPPELLPGCPDAIIDLQTDEGVALVGGAWRSRDAQGRLGGGRVCFNWYRIAVTIPERVGDLDPTGATVVLEVVVDDYAEVWVDGALTKAIGDTGTGVASG